MTPIPRLQCYILDTGHCLAHEYLLIQGGARTTVACHSIVALLRHPEWGWLLWDAGYAPHMLTATARFPYSLYRLATPLRLRPELAAAAQLPRYGLTPADIRAIVISHFHADHLAGLADFPTSRFIALREAYANIAGRTGLAALIKGFVPALLPADFLSRATLLGELTGAPIAELGPTYDLFGDQSARLVRLPGHARGQLGLLANTERGRILFVADSCWLARSVHEGRPPSRLTNFIVDDAAALYDTLAALSRFAEANPDVLIVPSHCPETFAREKEPAL
ncbi:MAG: MBL fold metallo-hydrolase [Caldilineaceae bacterium]|nr:MBL fold metallo-hydrolase [Caldilineaceae bacterium]